MLARWLPLLLVAALAAAALPSSAHGRVCLQTDGVVLDRGGHGEPGPTGATGDCPDADLAEFVLGWQDEPPFAGVKNGLDLGIRKPSNNDPIANVTTLQAGFLFGGGSHEVGTAPQFGKPGWYGEKIMPTRPGEYEVHVFGNLTIGGSTFPIDIETHLAEVEPVDDIAFPAQEAAGDGALAGRVATLEQKVTALENRQGTSNGGVTVEPPPGGKGAPGFEALSLLGALGVAVVVARRAQR
jgi:hypothetical protein